MVTLLSRRKLVKKIDKSYATIWRWMKNGDFPVPIVLNDAGPRKTIAWIEQEVDEWIANRRRQDYGPIEDDDRSN